MEIEKGIPVPISMGGPKRRKYPFKLMEVGDSFLSPCDEAARQKKMNTVRASVVFEQKRTPMKFITRQVPEGVRVWRSE